MSRSPFAYPMNRNLDGDAGSAADLQTDVMRFMAILALCLMAIFALVQSIPLAPVPRVEQAPAVATPAQKPELADEATDIDLPKEAAPVVADKTVVLTRPKWVSTFKSSVQDRVPEVVAIREKAEPELSESVTPDAPGPVADEVTESVEPDNGFTLRFESDQALMRLVAARQVGFYAIDTSRSQRMTVSNSRISFWDASTPNSFHEMEQATVPAPVVDALARTGVETTSVSWGVTLPGALRSQLDELMQTSQGGALVIAADGTLRLESGQ